ncbi:MAG: hypothetical protein QME68_07595 [Elusimicrobiota bacterium]|nr:hypothetical protein [Elusimicrobiota bacterium]
MNFKWSGVDCGSADHPMNTKIRDWMPSLAKECDEYFRRKFKKSIDEIFSPSHYQLMHIQLFPLNIIHTENLGGEIDKLLNKRITVGCFPWRFVGGESSICRIVAFENHR